MTTTIKSLIIALSLLISYSSQARIPQLNLTAPVLIVKQPITSTIHAICVDDAGSNQIKVLSRNYVSDTNAYISVNVINATAQSAADVLISSSYSIPAAQTVILNNPSCVNHEFDNNYITIQPATSTQYTSYVFDNAGLPIRSVTHTKTFDTDDNGIISVNINSNEVYIGGTQFNTIFVDRWNEAYGSRSTMTNVDSSFQTMVDIVPIPFDKTQYIVVGYFQGLNINGVQGNGTQNVFMARYDSTTHALTAVFGSHTAYSGLAYSVDTPVGAFMDDENRVYIYGHTTGSMHGLENYRTTTDYELFVTKMTLNGQRMWTRQWGAHDANDFMRAGVFDPVNRELYFGAQTFGSINPGEQEYFGEGDVSITRITLDGVITEKVAYGTAGEDDVSSLGVDGVNGRLWMGLVGNFTSDYSEGERGNVVYVLGRTPYVYTTVTTSTYTSTSTSTSTHTSTGTSTTTATTVTSTILTLTPTSAPLNTTTLAAPTTSAAATDDDAVTSENSEEATRLAFIIMGTLFAITVCVGCGVFVYKRWEEDRHYKIAEEPARKVNRSRDMLMSMPVPVMKEAPKPAPLKDGDAAKRSQKALDDAFDMGNLENLIKSDATIEGGASNIPPPPPNPLMYMNKKKATAKPEAPKKKRSVEKLLEQFDDDDDAEEEDEEENSDHDDDDAGDAKEQKKSQEVLKSTTSAASKNNLAAGGSNKALDQDMDFAAKMDNNYDF